MFTFPISLLLALVLGSQLQSADKKVRDAALSGLVGLGQAAWPAIDSVIKRLSDERCSWQELEILGKIGKPAIPKLLKVVDGNDRLAKWNAIRALGEMGRWGLRPYPRDQLKRITGFLKSDSVLSVKSDAALFRVAALEALSRIRDPSSVEPIIALLKKDTSIDMMIVAVKALGRFEENASPAIPALIDALRTWRPSELARPLKEEGFPQALKDAEFSSSMQFTFASIGEPAVEPLLNLIADEKQPRHVRQTAILAFSKMEASKVRDGALWPLLRLLDKEKSDLRLDMLWAISNICHDSARAARVLVRRGQTAQGMELVLTTQALIQADPENEHIVPYLLRVIEKDPDVDNKIQAICQIGREGMNGERTLGTLVKLLDSKDTFVRHHAILAIGRVGQDLSWQHRDSPKALEKALEKHEIIPALKRVVVSDPDPQRRNDAAETLSLLNRR